MTNLTLTPREYETMVWTSRGYTSKQTARQMGIATNTVREHRQNAYLKLGARNAHGAVSIAIQAGILP